MNYINYCDGLILVMCVYVGGAG